MHDSDEQAPADQAVMETLGELLAQRPRSLRQLVAGMQRDHYLRLRDCVELGKWPDGRRLTAGQLENAIQLLILYETHNLPEAERVLSQVPVGCGASPARTTVRDSEASPGDGGES